MGACSSCQNALSQPLQWVAPYCASGSLLGGRGGIGPAQCQAWACSCCPWAPVSSAAAAGAVRGSAACTQCLIALQGRWWQGEVGPMCLTVNCMGCVCSRFGVFCKNKKKKKRGERLHLLLVRFASTLFLPHPPSPSAPKSTDLAAFLVSGFSVLSDSCEMVGLVGLKQCGICVVEVVWFGFFCFSFCRCCTWSKLWWGCCAGRVVSWMWWTPRCCSFSVLYLWGLDFCSDRGIGGGEGTWDWVDGEEDKKVQVCVCGVYESERMKVWHARSVSSHHGNWGGRAKFADWIQFDCEEFVFYGENWKA